MSTVQSGVAGSIAAQAQQTSGKVQAVQPVSRQNTSFEQRTRGSVFGSLTMAPKMQGSATDNTRVAQIGAAYQNAPKANVTAIGAAYQAGAPQPQAGGQRPPQRNGSTAIGNLLGGGFGQMTANRAAQGLMTNPHVQNNERNKEQDNLKTSDQMLAEANNLTMKDMWAAA